MKYDIYEFKTSYSETVDEIMRETEFDPRSLLSEMNKTGTVELAGPLTDQAKLIQKATKSAILPDDIVDDDGCLWVSFVKEPTFLLVPSN